MNENPFRNLTVKEIRGGKRKIISHTQKKKKKKKTIRCGNNFESKRLLAEHIQVIER